MREIASPLDGFASPFGVFKFNPATLFAAGEDGAWYDPQSAANTLFQDSTLTTAAASGDPLGGVTDLSGNGKHLVQATALNRGVVATVNGKKMIRTTGSPTHLTCNTLAPVFAGTGKQWSVHMVVSQQSSGSGTVLSVGNSATTGVFLWLVAVLGTTLRAQWGYDTVIDANTLVPIQRIGNFEQVYSLVSNGTTVDIWANGVKVGSSSAATGDVTVDRFTLGALVRTTTANHGACRWGEIIVRAGAITDATVQQIHGYMANKWLPISPIIGGTVDLFIVAGQSNAEGRGTGGPAVAAGLGYEIDGGAVRSIADPVGGASVGSAWPALAQKWHDLTGRRAIVFETAYGGSGLVTGVGGTANWTTGVQRVCAAGLSTDAQTWIAARGLTLGKCYVVWAQGEQDAISINGTTITGAAYEAALGVLFDYLDANIPQVDGFLISSLGKLVDGTFDAGHTEIRGAQVNVATARADTHIAFDRAQYFVAESKMIDNVHYNQAGLNEMGEGIATFAAGLL